MVSESSAKSSFHSSITSLRRRISPSLSFPRFSSLRKSLDPSRSMSSSSSSPNSAGLLCLPPEVLDIILSLIATDAYHLPSPRVNPADSLIPDAVRSLLALGASCRQLSAHISVHVYSRIALTWTAWTDPPVVLLLRTLTCRPDLAALVREVTLTGWTMILLYNPKQGINSVFNDAEKERLVGWFGELGITEDKEWQQAISKGDCDAIAAVLLSMLPNLTNLNLDVDYSTHRELPVFFWRLLDLKAVRTSLAIDQQPEQQNCFVVPSSKESKSVSDEGAACNRSMFLNLRQIHYCTLRHPIYHLKHQPLDTDPMELLPLLHLPSLKSLSLSLADIAAFTRPLPISTSLTNLTLVTIQDETLEGLLRACPNISHLRFMLIRKSGDRFQWANMDTLRKALYVAKDTLVSIHIMTFWDGSGDWETAAPARLGPQGCLGPLTGLTKLKSLSLAPTYLLGWSARNIHSYADAIPPSLEELRVTDDLATIFLAADWEDGLGWELLMELLEKKVQGHENVKMLKRIVIEQAVENWKIDPLEMKAGEAGIEVINPRRNAWQPIVDHPLDPEKLKGNNDLTHYKFRSTLFSPYFRPSRARS